MNPVFIKNFKSNLDNKQIDLYLPINTKAQAKMKVKAKARYGVFDGP